MRVRSWRTLTIKRRSFHFVPKGSWDKYYIANRGLIRFSIQEGHSVCRVKNTLGGDQTGSKESKKWTIAAI